MNSIAPQLDYGKINVSMPSYKMTRLLPQQAIPAAPNTIISATGGTETTFLIPVVAMNLARSVLHFKITPVAGAAFNFLAMDTLTCFQQIQLYNQQGVMICDLQQPQNYTKVVWKSDIPFNEFVNYDTAYGGVGSGRFLRRSNGLAATGVTAGSFARRPDIDNSPASINYTENSYIEVGATGTATPVLDISIPLSMLKNTVFDIDKDILFNEVMTLRLVWGAAAKVGWNATGAAAPLTGAASILSADVQNVYLYLASERNQAIVNEIKSQIASGGGLTMPIPFVYSYKTVMGAQTSQTTIVKVTRAHGARLLKIYHSIFPSAETLNVVYNNSRTTATLVNFYSQLDDQRLQDFNVTLANNDDWIIMQRKLEGSITQSLDIYRYNWFWVDDFSDIGQTIKSQNEDNEIKGIDLSTDHTYYFNTTCDATAYNHYDFVVTQKILSISKQGILCQ